MHKLPSSTVKLISSTQVITSIYSVVKELVENSLDAAADSVDVRLEKGGLDKIEVIDNGTGISTSDIPFLCKPHFTSKIKDDSDLLNLFSYGFRGEAVHSLCSVADISVITKTKDDFVSQIYTFDKSGDISEQKPSHHNIGTIITVANIFKDIPVRRQIYNKPKKLKEELSQIEGLLMSYGLSHPRLRITLTNDKNIVWRKNRTSDYAYGPAISEILGKPVWDNLTELDIEEENFDIKLFVPKVDGNTEVVTRSISDRVFIFVNERPVMLKEIKMLLKKSVNFKSTFGASRWPMSVVYIKVKPNLVDVNLEPNKTRVLLVNMEQVLERMKSALDSLYVTIQEEDLLFDETCENSRAPLRIQGNNDRMNRNEKDLVFPASGDDISEHSTVTATSFQSTQVLNNHDVVIPADHCSLSISTGNYVGMKRIDNTVSSVTRNTISDSCTAKEASLKSTQELLDNFFDGIAGEHLEETISTENGISIERNVENPVSPITQSNTSDITVSEIDLQPTQALLDNSIDGNPGENVDMIISKAGKHSGFDNHRDEDIHDCAKLKKNHKCLEMSIKNPETIENEGDELILLSGGEHINDLDNQNDEPGNGTNFSQTQTVPVDLEEWSRGDSDLNICTPVRVLQPHNGDNDQSAKKRKQMNEETSTMKKVRRNSSIPRVVEGQRKLKEAWMFLENNSNGDVENCGFQLNEIKEKFRNRNGNNSTKKEIRVVGKIPSRSTLWSVVVEQKLFLLDNARLMEKLIYWKMLKEHNCRTEKLLQSVLLSGENLGVENYQYLYAIKEELSISDGVGKAISYPPFTLNGILIKRSVASRNGEDILEWTHGAVNIPNFNIDDLIEILERSKVEGEMYRPEKVKNWLKKEAKRLAQVSAQVCSSTELEESILELKNQQKQSNFELEVCLHNRPIMIPIKSIKFL